MSNLDGAFTIGSQLTEPMRVCLGISNAEARKRALALLAKVGIPNPERTFNAYPHQISGGMAQRVLIAGAVSCKPDLLIADEPTTALDVTVQAEVLRQFRRIHRDQGTAMLFISHDLGVVQALCDTILVMKSGEIVERLTSVQLAACDVHHPYTKALLAAIPALDLGPVAATAGVVTP
jgi:ABC-type dipeptide/oligopeptide/nickel transport system ATPase component